MADETVAWAPGSSDPKVAFAEFQLHLREVTPRLRVVPVVVALNVLVFAAMVAAGVKVLGPTNDQALRWGADYGPVTLGGEPWRLLTNVFVHFGIVHIAANMIALLSAGPVVERLFGPLAFAALYFAAGIAGSLLSVGAHPLVLSAGASGAIFGVYGALGVFVLRERGAIPRVVFSKLGSVAGSFIAYNIMYGAAHAGIDNTAHLGGLLGGAAAGAFLVRPLALGRPTEARLPALVVIATCVLVLAVTVALPRPVAFETITKTYGDREEPVLAHFNETLRQLNAGKISAEMAADDIERVTIPAWGELDAAVRRQGESWRRSSPPPLQVHVYDLLQQLIEIRQKGWVRMEGALRTGGLQAFVEAMSSTEASVQANLKQIEAVKSE